MSTEDQEGQIKRKPGRPPKQAESQLGPMVQLTADDPSSIETPININEDIARIAKMREKMPFGSFDRKLDLPPIEGYKQHWFVAKPGRIERALGAGWTYVLDDEGKPRSQVAGSDGIRQYAMKIPMQFWLEDVARSDKKAQDALNAVKKKSVGQNPMGASPADAEKFYTPDGRQDAVSLSR